MGIMLYPGLMDPDMAGEAERRSAPSSRGLEHPSNRGQGPHNNRDLVPHRVKGHLVLGLVSLAQDQDNPGSLANKTW